MSIEESLKEYILKHYKSLRDFCIRNDFAYSTINNIFIRGIMGSSVSLIISICNSLNIDIDSLSEGIIKEKSTYIETLTGHEKKVLDCDDFEYENNREEFNDVELYLINNFRELNKQGQEYIIQTIDMVSKQYKKAAESDSGYSGDVG